MGLYNVYMLPRVTVHGQQLVSSHAKSTMPNTIFSTTISLFEGALIQFKAGQVY